MTFAGARRVVTTSTSRRAIARALQIYAVLAPFTKNSRDRNGVHWQASLENSLANGAPAGPDAGRARSAFARKSGGGCKAEELYRRSGSGRKSVKSPCVKAQTCSQRSVYKIGSQDRIGSRCPARDSFDVLRELDPSMGHEEPVRPLVGRVGVCGR